MSRPKPLHWSHMLWIAAALGAVIFAVATIAVTGTGGGAAFRVVFWMLIGGVAGLLCVSILERIGVFRRTDE